MRYPFVKFKLGTRYGTKGKLWKAGYHTGLDLLSAGYGGDGIVYPLYTGRVMRVATNDKSYGNYVLIKHADGYITLYAHLKAIYVKMNMVVNEQTALGAEGATGNASGRHLHIEVHKGSYNYPAVIDPLEFIKGGIETEKMITIRLNGVVKTVSAIEKGGCNYIKLQDLRDGKIAIGYDAANKLPTVDV